MTSRHPTRPRRIDDALSRLIECLTPALTLADIPSDLPENQANAALAAVEENRHREYLERARAIIDAHPDKFPNNGADGPQDVSDLAETVRERLLGEYASPETAVRFSNLHSRLLAQEVMAQKEGILYFLYRLSEMGEEVGDDEEEEDGGKEEGRRSPLMDEGNLQRMLPGRGGRESGWNSEDEGPAAGSSVSQRSSQIGRADSARRVDERAHARSSTDRARDKRSSRGPSGAGSRDRAADEDKTLTPQRSAPGRGQNAVPPSERGLLRDLPYNLQGLSSTNLEFATASVLKLPASLPVPMVSLLNTLAEPCLLYRGLADFVESSDGGLVSQSLQSALTTELRSYLGLVGTLEGEVRRALTAAKENDEPTSVSKSGVTLKRCVVWTRDATMALRLMSLIAEESRSEYLSLMLFGSDHASR